MIKAQYGVCQLWLMYNKLNHIDYKYHDVLSPRKMVIRSGGTCIFTDLSGGAIGDVLWFSNKWGGCQAINQIPPLDNMQTFSLEKLLI